MEQDLLGTRTRCRPGSRGGLRRRPGVLRGQIGASAPSSTSTTSSAPSPTYKDLIKQVNTDAMKNFTSEGIGRTPTAAPQLPGGQQQPVHSRGVPKQHQADTALPQRQPGEDDKGLARLTDPDTPDLLTSSSPRSPARSTTTSRRAHVRVVHRLPGPRPGQGLQQALHVVRTYTTLVGMNHTRSR